VQISAVVRFDGPAFNNAYKPFEKGRPIPKYTLDNLTQFTLSSDEYHVLITSRELERWRFIFLDVGKTKFDHAILPPHGEVIVEVTTQTLHPWNSK
jgi:hypothetical protein